MSRYCDAKVFSAFSVMPRQADARGAAQPTYCNVVSFGIQIHFGKLLIRNDALRCAQRTLPPDGVRPYDVHLWHMSMFWDAIDWVSLPNTLGMSQYGDGGIVGTKPYAASGNYINRMSDHCRHCRYDPAKGTGENACPFTTLYWDFLLRHAQRFSKNSRMRQQYANLRRKDAGEMKNIRAAAEKLRTTMRRG